LPAKDRLIELRVRVPAHLDASVAREAERQGISVAEFTRRALVAAMEGASE